MSTGKSPDVVIGAGVVGVACAFPTEPAARAIAAQLYGTPAVTEALRRRRAGMRVFADTVGAAHAPGPRWAGWLTDDTDVCRCEEVAAGRIRAAVDDLGTAARAASSS
ncbi:hypothetical protein [Streptomyces sp. NBC_01210]|uniref:hypothetical protein n=1 Tax=Streptomyces sp. NBC_01210 TaxID=2903774 RepID=UPI002E132BC0